MSKISNLDARIYLFMSVMKYKINNVSCKHKVAANIRFGFVELNFMHTARLIIKNPI